MVAKFVLFKSDMCQHMPEIAFVREVGMHVCVCACLSLRLLITSGMIWTRYDRLTSSTAFIYIRSTAAAVDISSR